jgi:hypothetical protein
MFQTVEFNQGNNAKDLYTPDLPFHLTTLHKGLGKNVSNWSTLKTLTKVFCLIKLSHLNCKNEYVSLEVFINC